MLATAGGLVISGGTNDRKVLALDAKDGKVLWEFPTSSGQRGHNLPVPEGGSGLRVRTGVANADLAPVLITSLRPVRPLGRGAEFGLGSRSARQPILVADMLLTIRLFGRKVEELP